LNQVSCAGDREGFRSVGTALVIATEDPLPAAFNPRQCSMGSEYHFYGDLARWWPLISPPSEYEDESEYVAALLKRARIPVQSIVEFGSGGGHVAFHLKDEFEHMVLVDLSDEMLTVSRQLNPECEHVRDDMRTARLGRVFDAVLVYDAIDYMVTEEDLGRTLATAFIHCRPGGVGLFVPDHIVENFETATDHGGSDAPDGRGVRYLEWTTDRDPTDTVIETAYAFLLREAGGHIDLVHETHQTGLFPRATWLRLIAEVGFEPETVVEETKEDRTPRELFLAHRPL
jgi:SAM-dependent methyltransferase